MPWRPAAAASIPSVSLSRLYVTCNGVRTALRAPQISHKVRVGPEAAAWHEGVAVWLDVAKQAGHHAAWVPALSLRPHLVGKLLQPQRLVQTILRHLVDGDGDAGVGHAVHHAAGQRGTRGRRGARGAQVHDVVRAEAVLRQRGRCGACCRALRREHSRHNQRSWASERYGSMAWPAGTIAGAGEVLRQDIPSAHDQHKAHLVVDEREQAAAQQATLHIFASEVEQRASPLRRSLWRQPCQLTLQIAVSRVTRKVCS